MSQWIVTDWLLSAVNKMTSPPSTAAMTVLGDTLCLGAAAGWVPPEVVMSSKASGVSLDRTRKPLFKARSRLKYRDLRARGGHDTAPSSESTRPCRRVACGRRDHLTARCATNGPSSVPHVLMRQRVDLRLASSCNCGMDRVGVSDEHGYRGCAEYLRLTPFALWARGRSMMESEGWPLDAVSAAELVVRVIDELDHRSNEASIVLLSDLLRAAWPSCWAQDQ
jgi:hypothetical protein